MKIKSYDKNLRDMVIKLIVDSTSLGRVEINNRGLDE